MRPAEGEQTEEAGLYIIGILDDDWPELVYTGLSARRSIMPIPKRVSRTSCFPIVP